MKPLRERQFRLLWLGQVASGMGDALVPVALAFAVLSVNRSATALGGVLAAFTLTRVVFSLVGGVVADRLPRRAVMLACDAVRAVVEAFTAAMLFSHHMTLPLFVITSALFGAASAFFGPASDGLVPQTVSPENLQSANALRGISRNALNIFGPAVSGALVALAGTGWVFAIDSASFVVSAFFLLRLQVRTHIRAEPSRFMLQLREGFHEVTSRPWVRAPIIGFAISNFCFAAFIVLGPRIFLDHFNGARDWGIVSACGAIGGILGGLASVRFQARHPLSAGFFACMLIAVPIAALAGPLPVAAVAAAWTLGLGAVALCNTWWETALQREIPESVYARVRSYDILVSIVFMPLGFVVFPLLARGFGFERTLLAAAGVTAATNLVVAFLPGVHAVTEAPVTAQAEPTVA
ncbi:MAG TPA: MFS transporter [Gaiellaceae bacterium]|nr:MFS transporter [Gaiellaceae bacterium]